MGYGKDATANWTAKDRKLRDKLADVCIDPAEGERLIAAAIAEVQASWTPGERRRRALWAEAPAEIAEITVHHAAGHRLIYRSV